MGAPFGWLATRADGSTALFSGAQPVAADFASVTPLAAVSDFTAAQAALRTPTRAIDFVDYAQRSFAKALATGGSFNVAASGATAIPILCDGTGSTMGNLAMLALFGQQNPTGTKTWVDNNGASTVVTGAQLVTLATLVGTWSDDLYASLGQVLAGIASSPAAITTTAQIDAAFAAT